MTSACCKSAQGGLSKRLDPKPLQARDPTETQGRGSWEQHTVPLFNMHVSFELGVHASAFLSPMAYREKQRDDTTSAWSRGEFGA